MLFNKQFNLNTVSVRDYTIQVEISEEQNEHFYEHHFSKGKDESYGTTFKKVFEKELMEIIEEHSDATLEKPEISLI
jgi:hypothetical protein